MTYKEALAEAMQELAKDPLVRFVGYGLKYGGMGGGSLKGIDPAKVLELPTAENLMASFAIGLSLKGLRPLVYFERMDFMGHAFDAIVNHLDKINEISDGAFKPAAILRAVVGNKSKPLFTGATHCQNFTQAFRSLVSFPIMTLESPNDVLQSFRVAHGFLKDSLSTLIVEYKDSI